MRHSQKIAMAWRDACENYNIYIIWTTLSICRQFGKSILDALEDTSFMIFYAHSGMNERNSSLEVFLRIWHNLTVKHRDLKEKNCRLQKRDTTHNSWTPNSTQSLADRWSPVIQKLDCDTQLDDQPSNASLVRNRWWVLFPKGRSQWVTRVISTWSGDSHMSHLHFWFTCSCTFILHWMWCQTSFPATTVCSLC